jgi:hypothetical protein
MGASLVAAKGTQEVQVVQTVQAVQIVVGIKAGWGATAIL